MSSPGSSVVALPTLPSTLVAIVACFVRPGADAYTTQVVYVVNGPDKIIRSAHRALSIHNTVRWDSELGMLIVTLPQRFTANENRARKRARQLPFAATA